MQKHCPRCHKIIELNKDNYIGTQKLSFIEYGFKKEKELHLHNCTCDNTVSTYVKVEGVNYGKEKNK
jgi:hypothetical protein